MKTDPTVSSLHVALGQRREIEFRLDGAPVTLRPHILYVDKSGVMRIAGPMGEIPVARIPIGKVTDLVVSPRHFEPDLGFDFGHPDYDNPVASVADI